MNGRHSADTSNPGKTISPSPIRVKSLAPCGNHKGTYTYIQNKNSVMKLGNTHKNLDGDVELGRNSDHNICTEHTAAILEVSGIDFRVGRGPAGAKHPEYVVEEKAYQEDSPSFIAPQRNLLDRLNTKRNSIDIVE